MPASAQTLPTKTLVLRRGPQRFDMSGQALPQILNDTDEKISDKLAGRLRDYALDRLAGAGFAHAVEGWELEVYTMDGDEGPAYRYYTVKFTNPLKGYIEVCGICASRGRPTLDHGFAIGDADA